MVIIYLLIIIIIIIINSQFLHFTYILGATGAFLGGMATPGQPLDTSLAA